MLNRALTTGAADIKKIIRDTNEQPYSNTFEDLRGIVKFLKKIQLIKTSLRRNKKTHEYTYKNESNEISYQNFHTVTRKAEMIISASSTNYLKNNSHLTQTLPHVYKRSHWEL